MKVELSLDRFEGKLAVLLTDDGRQIDFPKSLLPKGVKAGDILTFDIERDLEATQRLKDDTKSLQDELRQRDPGGDIEL